MSDSRISSDDRVIKHLGRLEVGLKNLLAFWPDPKTKEFLGYVQSQRAIKKEILMYNSYRGAKNG